MERKKKQKKNRSNQKLIYRSTKSWKRADTAEKRKGTNYSCLKVQGRKKRCDLTKTTAQGGEKREQKPSYRGAHHRLRREKNGLGKEGGM